MLFIKRQIYWLIKVFALCFITVNCFSQSKVIFNRAPLKTDSYAQLPLGSIKARGWLLKQLELQKAGATGHAEELYPGKDDLGEHADWLGGTGSSWEKAPYYLKGLTALAYTLDNDDLKARAQKWIDYTLNHQQESGLFGPVNMNDWWPRMPMLYALQNYYEATDDKRVLGFMSRYFKYELDNLDSNPLRDWGKARAGDNIEIALWLYNYTGESYLLDLANKLKAQAYPWADIFNNNQFFYFGNDFHTRHMVSVAQALKFPVIYSQLNPDSYYTNAMQKGIAYIRRDNGQPQGLGSGTEFLAGSSAVQGVETCTVVEWMQSLETAFRIQHDVVIGDQLEKIAFNALPAQFSPDFKQHMYYTLPNQIVSIHGPHGFNQEYTNCIVPSPYSGYPCCRYNMHMGWPYFIKNSWYATPDNGLAVSTYGPMEVTATVAKNTRLKIEEDTAYPFEEDIRLTLSLSKSATFPLKFRIPGWCANPHVLVNGKAITGIQPGQILVVNRLWHSNDKITLNFPMQPAVKPQVNNAVSIERGPLVYALKIKQLNKNLKEYAVKGFYETEIYPSSPWNYGLVLNSDSLSKNITVVKSKMPENPFIQDVTPVTLKLKAKRIPSWTIDYNGTAAFDVPFSPVASKEETEEITLVPYGSETLRVSIFPTIGHPDFIKTTYTENFDNNTALGLVVYGGGWFCKDNAIHTAANQDGKSGPGTKIIATGTKFADFKYTADISINTAGDAGLVFRVNNTAIGTDAYKGYYLALNAQTGMIQLGKAVNQKWTVIALSKFPLEMKKFYKVTIKAVKDKIDIYINDEKKPVISAFDTEYSIGSIGLRAYNALASIDNITVNEL